MADAALGHSITGAPLAIKGKIVVGMAGGEYGVRGFIDAYDAKTGNARGASGRSRRPGNPAVKPGPATA